MCLNVTVLRFFLIHTTLICFPSADFTARSSLISVQRCNQDQRPIQSMGNTPLSTIWTKFRKNAVCYCCRTHRRDQASCDLLCGWACTYLYICTQLCVLCYLYIVFFIIYANKAISVNTHVAVTFPFLSNYMIQMIFLVCTPLCSAVVVLKAYINKVELRAVGVDEILPEYLKSQDGRLSWLMCLCNIAWQLGIVPLKLQTRKVEPLFKRLDRRVSGGSYFSVSPWEGYCKQNIKKKTLSTFLLIFRPLQMTLVER